MISLYNPILQTIDELVQQPEVWCMKLYLWHRNRPANPKWSPSEPYLWLQISVQACLKWPTPINCGSPQRLTCFLPDLNIICPLPGLLGDPGVWQCNRGSPRNQSVNFPDLLLTTEWSYWHKTCTQGQHWVPMIRSRPLLSLEWYLKGLKSCVYTPTPWPKDMDPTSLYQFSSGCLKAPSVSKWPQGGSPHIKLSWSASELVTDDRLLVFLGLEKQATFCRLWTSIFFMQQHAESRDSSYTGDRRRGIGGLLLHSNRHTPSRRVGAKARLAQATELWPVDISYRLGQQSVGW